MGLISAGEVHSSEVERGIDYLLSKQDVHGTWEEESFTGTGFPRVFYLRYHDYRHYFPLMALGDVCAAQAAAVFRPCRANTEKSLRHTVVFKQPRILRKVARLRALAQLNEV